MAKRANTTLPRGIRNNNPLNIRIGNVWLGEEPVNTDGHFEQFVTMAYGCRAAFVLLRRYINHYHLNTIRDIISRWAPSGENDTARYIDFVSKQTQIDPDAPLSFSDKTQMCEIVASMAFVENGRNITFKDIEKGYDMA